MERGELDADHIVMNAGSNNWNKLMLEQHEEIVFVASASLLRSWAKELTIELLTQPFSLTEQDINYRRVLATAILPRGVTILHRRSGCGDTSLLIRMLEIDRIVSFLPWYAVENNVKRGEG